MEPKKTNRTDSKDDKATSDLAMGADQAAQVKGGVKPTKPDQDLSATVKFK